jgi:hypothetical protein
MPADSRPPETEKRPGCEVVIQWGNQWRETIFCGSPATKRYPAMGGGFMHLCDEHSIKHLNYVEDIPKDWWRDALGLDVPR